MKKKTLEAWQKAPVKIVSEAINHAEKQNEEDNLIGFLLLDVGAEMLLKTYLGLPKQLTGATTSEDERHVILRKGFHDIVEGVKNSRAGISEKDLARVEFFHGIRNKLYHQGNGLTVQRTHLNEYLIVIKGLFKQLLKIDLDEQLPSTSLTKEEVETISLMKDEVVRYLNVSRAKRDTLHLCCNLAIEIISPELLLPSFKKKFGELREKSFSDYYYAMDGDEVITARVMPKDINERIKIVDLFMSIITPSIKNSNYYDALNLPVKIGNKYEIEALSSHIGVKSIEIERREVSGISSILFNDSFDLDDFYYNIVSIVILDDVFFMYNLSMMFFDYDKMYPRQYYESEIEYLESMLDTCKSNVKVIDDYIFRIGSWLEKQRQQPS